MQSYKAARSLFSFCAFLAWSAIIIGAITSASGFAAVAQYSSNIMASLSASVPGLIVAAIGFFALVGVQMARAQVDSAEYAQQSLKVARDQLAFAKQAHLENGLAEKAPMKPADHTPAKDTLTHNGTPIIAQGDGTYLVQDQAFLSLDAAEAFIDSKVT